MGEALSARRRYARRDLVGAPDHLFRPRPSAPPEPAGCRAAFFTPGVVNTREPVERGLKESLAALHLAVVERQLDDRDEPATARPRRRPGHCELVLVDKADRLGAPSLEQLRARCDEFGAGLALIGTPGLEERLARHPQPYSRAGSAHAFQPLGQEELRFARERRWARLGGALRADDLTGQEAAAAIVPVAGGDSRPPGRLPAQAGRIERPDGLGSITREAVEAARERPVIGAARAPDGSFSDQSSGPDSDQSDTLRRASSSWAEAAGLATRGRDERTEGLFSYVSCEERRPSATRRGPSGRSRTRRSPRSRASSRNSTPPTDVPLSRPRDGRVPRSRRRAARPVPSAGPWRRSPRAATGRSRARSRPSSCAASSTSRG